MSDVISFPVKKDPYPFPPIQVNSVLGGMNGHEFVKVDTEGRLCAICPQCHEEHGLDIVPDPYLLAIEKEAVEVGQVAGLDVLRLVAEVRRLKGG